MGKVLIITIAVVIFILLNLIFYKFLNVYYKNEFGKKMWKTGVTNIYFWQGSILFSTFGTALIMYLLKWAHILTF
jgi:hypothetical protein